MLTLYLKDTRGGDGAQVVAGFTCVAAGVFLRGVTDGKGGNIVVIVHHAVSLVLHHLPLLLQPARGQGRTFTTQETTRQVVINIIIIIIIIY